MKRQYIWAVGAATIFCWLLIGGMARADWIRTFQASDATHLAQTVFAYDSTAGTLTVKMANLYTGGTNFDANNNLTAFFYDADFTLDTDNGTATLATGSTVVKANHTGNLATWTWPVSDPPPGDVGTEYAYKNGLSGAPNNASQGFSSAGLGLFGPDDRFETTYHKKILSPPASPSGENFGLIPGTTVTVFGSLLKYPLIKKEVWFTFTDVGDLSLKADSIFVAGFQYGTALTDPYTPVPVPEPGTIIMLAGLGVMLGGKRRKKAEEKGDILVFLNNRTFSLPTQTSCALHARFMRIACSRNFL